MALGDVERSYTINLIGQDKASSAFRKVDSSASRTQKIMAGLTKAMKTAALAAGVAITPGPEWSTDKAHSLSRMRLCFASPSHEEIREGGAVLAEVCRKEFGVPARSANIERKA